MKDEEITFFFRQLQTLLSSTTTEHSLGLKNPNTTPQSSEKTQQKSCTRKHKPKLTVFTFQFPFHSFRQPQLTQRDLFVKEGFKFLLQRIKYLTSNKSVSYLVMISRQPLEVLFSPQPKKYSSEGASTGEPF